MFIRYIFILIVSLACTNYSPQNIDLKSIRHLESKFKWHNVIIQIMEDKKFIKKATYPGGQIALKQFIKSNLVYPQEALIAKIEGDVMLKFKINSKGDVIEAKVMKGLGYGCDQEALRLVKILKYPKAINRKIRVTTSKKIKIKFRLPKENKTIIKYTIVK